MGEGATVRSATGKPAFRWSLFSRHLLTFAGVAMVLGLVAAVVTGRGTLESRAAGVMSRGPVTVRFEWPMLPKPKDAPKNAPAMTWMPKEKQIELLAEAGRRIGAGGTGFDRTGLDAVREWLAASGWFEGPPRVELERDGGVVIFGTWREPVAVIKHAGEEHWISWQGKYMPPVYPPGRAVVRTIESPRSGQPKLPSGAVDASKPWPGDDVAAGLELLALLMKQKWYGQVAGIDLSEFADRGTLTILTRQGTRIVWGGRPSTPKFGDTGTPDKLRNLDTLYADTGRIDAGYPKVFINSQYLLFDRRMAEQAIAAKGAGNATQPAGKKPAAPDRRSAAAGGR